MQDPHAKKTALTPSQGAVVETLAAAGGKTDSAHLVRRARADDHELDLANLLFDLERDLRSLHAVGLVEFSRVMRERKGIPHEEPVLATELDQVFPLNPMADWDAEPVEDQPGLELRVGLTRDGQRRFPPKR